MSQRKPVICVVDVVVVVDGKNVVMIKRNIEPYQDKLCLPGGHVDFTDESLAHAAARELYEEVNIAVLPDQLRHLCELDAPNRDPRPDVRRISIAYIAELSGPDVKNMRPASDAKSVALVNLFTLQAKDVGFDHFRAILQARLTQGRSGCREALSRLRQQQADLRQMAASGFLFHVSDDGESVIAAIVSIEYWEKYHRLDDSKNNDRFFENFDLFPTCEKGIYSPPYEMTIDQLRAKLLTDGFVEDPEFSAFLERSK